MRLYRTIILAAVILLSSATLPAQTVAGMRIGGYYSPSTITKALGKPDRVERVEDMVDVNNDGRSDPRYVYHMPDGSAFTFLDGGFFSRFKVKGRKYGVTCGNATFSVGDRIDDAFRVEGAEPQRDGDFVTVFPRSDSPLTLVDDGNGKIRCITFTPFYM